MSTIDELQRVLDKHFPENRRYRELSYTYGTELRYYFAGGERYYVRISAGGNGEEVPLKTFTEPEKLDTFLTLLFN